MNHMPDRGSQSARYCSLLPGFTPSSEAGAAEGEAQEKPVPSVHLLRLPHIRRASQDETCGWFPFLFLMVFWQHKSGTEAENWPQSSACSLQSAKVGQPLTQIALLGTPKPVGRVTLLGKCPLSQVPLHYLPVHSNSGYPSWTDRSRKGSRFVQEDPVGSWLKKHRSHYLIFVKSYIALYTLNTKTVDSFNSYTGINYYNSTATSTCFCSNECTANHSNFTLLHSVAQLIYTAAEACQSKLYHNSQ